MNLLLDEIHINYKAGHLIDMSENSKFEATTIQIYHNFTYTLPVQYFFFRNTRDQYRFLLSDVLCRHNIAPFKKELKRLTMSFHAVQ